MEAAYAAKLPRGHQDKQDADLDDDFNLPTIPQEEIERLALEEGLSETERIKVLLSKTDQATQQEYVFHNAVNIFAGNPDGIQEEIIPIILVFKSNQQSFQKGLTSYSEHLQIEAGSAFSELLSKQILSSAFYKELKSASLQMLKQWSKGILFSWIDVYTKIIPLMSTEQGDSASECVQLSLKMAEYQQPMNVRIASANFFGKIAKTRLLTSESFISNLMAKIKELSSDGDAEIRIEVLRSYSFISECLGQDLCLSHIIPLIKDRIEDVDKDVQRKAINQMLIHAHLKWMPESYFNSEDFKVIIKSIIAIANNHHECPMHTRNSILKRISLILDKFDVGLFANDSEFEQSLISFLNYSRKSEFGRSHLPQILGKLHILYGSNGKLSSKFFPQVIESYLKSELSQVGIGKDTKKAIASCIHSLIIGCLTDCMNTDYKEHGHHSLQHLLESYKALLDLCNKEITNELVKNVYSILEFVGHNQKQISSSHIQGIHQIIKEPFLNSVEQTLLQNWRFHLNYHEHFLSKYLLLAEKDEATLTVYPLLLKGATDVKTSQPVKRFLANFFADVIHKQANMYLRMAIQESMLKDLAKSPSSQLRQIFVYFLESLIPSMSKSYFKQVFQEAYFSLGTDTVNSILLGFVKLAPAVRHKLDEVKAIEQLERCLQAIKERASEGAHKFKDLSETTEKVLMQLKDQKFLQQVQLYQVTVEKELVESEWHLRDLEKSDKNDSAPQKRREMELFIKKMREQGVQTGFKRVGGGLEGGGGPQSPAVISMNPLRIPQGSGNRTPSILTPSRDKEEQKQGFAEKSKFVMSNRSSTSSTDKPTGGSSLAQAVAAMKRPSLQTGPSQFQTMKANKK